VHIDTAPREGFKNGRREELTERHDDAQFGTERPDRIEDLRRAVRTQDHKVVVLCGPLDR
jgi:hypothetical protein